MWCWSNQKFEPYSGCLEGQTSNMTFLFQPCWTKAVNGTWPYKNHWEQTRIWGPSGVSQSFSSVILSLHTYMHMCVYVFVYIYCVYTTCMYIYIYILSYYMMYMYDSHSMYYIINYFSDFRILYTHYYVYIISTSFKVPTLNTRFLQVIATGWLHTMVINGKHKTRSRKKTKTQTVGIYIYIYISI